METLVYVKIDGSGACGRVQPKAGARDGTPPKQFAADLNKMHIIDEGSGSWFETLMRGVFRVGSAGQPPAPIGLPQLAG